MIRTAPLPHLLALLALAACGEDGTSTLVGLDELGAGEGCPAGGVVVNVGVDDDGDGLLAADEVDDSRVVCHGDDGDDGTPGDEGTDGTSALLRTTRLERGDPDCPFGGVRVEAGLDDGSGGGTAGDGTLQDGEVDDAEAVCDGASSLDVAELDPPAGPAGRFTIDLSGGEGACGGGGGDLELGSEGYGLPGGHVEVFATGEADAAFTLPVFTTDLGPLPLEVTSDVTLAAYEDTDCNGVPNDPSGLAVGDLYQVSCWNAWGPSATAVLRWTGTAGEIHTGMHVAAGASITFAAPANPAQIGFAYDVVNEGTISVLGTHDGTKYLSVQARVFHGRPGSLISMPAAPGTLGSSVLVVQPGGALVNEGTIDVRGKAGGTGGSVTLSGGTGLWNTGDVLASGGAAVDGDGGGGGFVSLRASARGIHNSGLLDVRGASGTGPAGDGGRGGNVRFDSDDGDVRNVGAVEAGGGDGSPTCDEACDGGAAKADGDGAIALLVDGGRVLTSGDLRADGGAAALDGTGGDGGTIRFYVDRGELIGAGDLEVSGDLSARGGDGDTAGNGGRLLAAVDPGGARSVRAAATPGTVGPVRVAFLGYTDVSVAGGSSDGEDCDGGDAGTLTVSNDCPSDPSQVAGATVFLPALDGRGGASLHEAGGHGGYGAELYLYACQTAGRARFAGTAVGLLGGPLDLRGGDSEGAGGGYGGDVYVYAFDHAELRGAVDVSGGAGVDGGEGGYVQAFAAGGQVTVTAPLTADGGDADEEGGAGGSISLEGWTVDASAPLSCTGGDGVVGGDGGWVETLSLGGTSVLTGAVDVDAGAGSTADGVQGGVTIDGFEAP